MEEIKMRIRKPSLRITKTLENKFSYDWKTGSKTLLCEEGKRVITVKIYSSDIDTTMVMNEILKVMNFNKIEATYLSHETDINNWFLNFKIIVTDLHITGFNHFYKLYKKGLGVK
jgi:hypothetical protein